MDALEQAAGGYGKSPSQLHERVDSGQSRAALQDSDLSPVKRGTKADLFLAEARSLARFDEISPEAFSDVH